MAGTIAARPGAKKAAAKKVGKKAVGNKAGARKPAAKKLAIKKPLAKKSLAKRAAPKNAVANKAAVALRYEPGRLIVCADSLGEGVAALQAIDPGTIALLLEIGGAPPLRSREPGFAGLAAIVVSQQVSVASARAIFGRLEARLRPLEAATVLAAGEDELRACGLSGPKLRALICVARAVAEGLDLARLGLMPAAEAHRALVAVKGIGPWTADIFLLFCLGHPDAFPAGDLALQEAAKLALGLPARPAADALESLAERWRPWRGVAARMLWAYYGAVKARAGVIGEVDLAQAAPTR